MNGTVGNIKRNSKFKLYAYQHYFSRNATGAIQPSAFWSLLPGSSWVIVVMQSRSKSLQATQVGEVIMFVVASEKEKRASDIYVTIHFPIKRSLRRQFLLLSVFTMLGRRISILYWILSIITKKQYNKVICMGYNMYECLKHSIIKGRVSKACLLHNWYP